MVVIEFALAPTSVNLTRLGHLTPQPRTVAIELALAATPVNLTPLRHLTLERRTIP